MHNNDIRKQFIETLEEVPFVKYAAKKVGINRTTIYRWMQEDPRFRIQVEKSLGEGRKLLIEDAEYQLLKKIRKDGNQRAIEFFLKHNNKKYYPRKTMEVYPLAEDQYQMSFEEHAAIELWSEKFVELSPMWRRIFSDMEKKLGNPDEDRSL